LSQINLLPREYRHQRQSLSPAVWLLIAGILIFGGMVGISSYLYLNIGEKEVQLSKINQQIECNKLQADAIDQVLRNEKELKDKEQHCELWDKNHDLWSRLLENVSRTVPPGLRLREMKINDKGYLIKGFAASHREIATLMVSLESPDIFRSVKLQSTEFDKRLHGINFELICQPAEGGNLNRGSDQ